ncbi:ParA family protein (plasmid) [Leifsonia sp. ZF2019]|uniref:ParA family protein n=1 Tax=Leifsonia sp. ZF2019 TaxID=2781978 RepID=UPI001CBC1868|nr:ParA family protein [Leifsonia sp. ZF2019]UAJ81726.1 ParA family protein [Leifsonia sp. ZF2019]
MRIVAAAGQKGGIGKTTSVINLSAVLAKGGSRVLVVDADAQRSTTWWAENAGEDLPFDFAPDVDPANLSRLRELPYDLVMVDTPGNLEATATLSAVLDSADFVILPLAPEPLAVQPLVRTVKSLVEPRGLDYRVLLNNIDRRRGDSHLDDWESIVDSVPLKRFRNHVRKSASVIDASIKGRVVTDFNDTRENRAAIFDYNAVALELQSIWANAPVSAGVN